MNSLDAAVRKTRIVRGEVTSEIQRVYKHSCSG